jgi:hypothetical protein
MIILDFLIYYFTIWFEKRKANLKWSTPIQRANYVIGLATSLFLSNGFIIFTYITTKQINFGISKYWLLGGALILIQLFEYIYDTRKRFEMLTLDASTRFNIFNDSKGIAISMCIFFFLFLSPFITAIILAIIRN